VCIILEKSECFQQHSKKGKLQHFSNRESKIMYPSCFGADPIIKSQSRKVSGDQGCEGEGKMSESDLSKISNSRLHSSA